MHKPSINDLIKLYENIFFPFYGIKRDMYIPAENERRENDAEHSWSLAVLALILANTVDPKLRLDKVLSYALIHDLVEIYAGDTSVWAPKKLRETKETREKIATTKLRLNLLNYPDFFDLIREYRDQQNDESKFIYALDKLHNSLTVFSGKETYFRAHNKITKEQVDQKAKEQRAKAATHSGVVDYYDQLLKEVDRHPEYFFREAKK